MPPAAQAASLAARGDIVILQTLAISHPDISTIYLVSDSAGHTIGGTAYTRFAFEVVPPTRNSTDTPAIEITVGIADQTVMQALLQLRGQSDVMIAYKEVQADTYAELFSANFKFQSLTTNGSTQAKITATFLAGALNQSYPAARISPSNVG